MSLGLFLASVGAVFAVFDRSYLSAPLQTPHVEWSADFLREPSERRVGLLRFCTQSSPLGRGGGGQILQGGANSFCIQLHHKLPICATSPPLLPWCVISVDIRSLAYKVPRIRSMQVCNHNMVHVSKRDLRCVQNKVRFKICLHLSFQNQHSFVP